MRRGLERFLSSSRGDAARNRLGDAAITPATADGAIALATVAITRAHLTRRSIVAETSMPALRSQTPEQLGLLGLELGVRKHPGLVEVAELPELLQSIGVLHRDARCVA